jgi:hypothetical protein
MFTGIVGSLVVVVKTAMMNAANAARCSRGRGRLPSPIQLKRWKKIMEIPGVLEIDHERGVIYFHTDDEEALKLYQTTNILRICGLGKMRVGRIDITLRPKNQLDSNIAATISYDAI